MNARFSKLAIAIAAMPLFVTQAVAQNSPITSPGPEPVDAKERIERIVVTASGFARH